jgi:ankyrin repeat protein
MLELLESKGADYSIKSIMGFSPIHMAIENDAILSLAYFYYKKKLDFEVRTKQGHTPLLFAVSIG